MKKMNKGFSMVELIIVIAIMAILAGALAPALIRYINKSRISTDIQTANTIATGIQTAIANEGGYDEAVANYNTAWYDCTTVWGKTDDFAESLKTTVGSKAPQVKSKKCVSKGGSAATGSASDKEFYFYIDMDKNAVLVRLGDTSGDHLAFPTAAECLQNEEATHTATAAAAVSAL
ncbi:MAG: type II secretion system GspH family protein [Lachnospiraceae bacterium]|nr:type II secretion system GspH family protein [Lachnospiraceae bacterium]